MFYFQTKKYADVIIPRGADNKGDKWKNIFRDDRSTHYNSHILYVIFIMLC